MSAPATAVRERPIRLTGEEVRAVLDGRKTQARSVVKARHRLITGDDGVLYDADGIEPGKPITPDTCPFGKPGDRLWVTMSSESTRITGTANRFWERVVKSGGCWEWFGQVNKKRYGIIRIGTKTVATHRLSWEMHNGLIPGDKHVLHTCDVPWCVRPDHLYLGTNTENIADKVSRGRTARVSGSRNGGSRLTDEQVAELRRLYDGQNWKQADLASRYGISQGHVSKILSGERWLAEATGREMRPIGRRTLELTDVRVERLQDITWQDCRAEGVRCGRPIGRGVSIASPLDYVREYRSRWDSLNAKRGDGWDLNKWVWALSFRRIDA